MLTKIRREQARRELLDFTRYTFPRYVADPAHELLAEYLDAVVDGEIERLMVYAPPQHGKSELVSIRLPAYWLGRRPDEPIIISSYAASLAYRMSRHARNLVESTKYGELFPGVETSADSRAVDFWELARPNRGGLRAAGVGGPITGHGAMLGIIDDPIENWQQAQSQVIRDKQWEWWKSTFRPRIWEGGAIVLVMTRWHEDDLAGRLLRDQSDKWVVLRLPALAENEDERETNDKRLGLPIGDADPLSREPGEPLCPSRFSAQALGDIRADVGGYVWAAEYQGVPRPLEGNLAKRSWFEVVGAAPAEGVRARYWDLAATEKKRASGEPDWTVGLKLVKHRGVYYVERVDRTRSTPGEVDKLILQTAKIDGLAVRIGVEQEPGASGKMVVASYVRLLDGYNVRGYPSKGDKVTRAMPWLAQAEAGNVKLVNGSWCEALLDEIESFPMGAHDDQVDGMSGAYGMLVGVADTGAALASAQETLATPSRWTWGGQGGPRWKRTRRR